MDYATAVHSCCCGCGDRVVTPFTPTDWRMTFDGESISLHPSVGNWNQKCRSHYVIKRSRVLEAGPWSNTQIEAERLRDKKAKAGHYAVTKGPQPTKPEPPAAESVGISTAPPMGGLWSNIKSWFR